MINFMSRKVLTPVVEITSSTSINQQSFVNSSLTNNTSKQSSRKRCRSPSPLTRRTSRITSTALKDNRKNHKPNNSKSCDNTRLSSKMSYDISKSSKSKSRDNTRLSSKMSYDISKSSKSKSQGHTKSSDVMSRRSHDSKSHDNTDPIHSIAMDAFCDQFTICDNET